MEILGLDPYQSETQYRFFKSAGEEIKWKYFSTLFPLYFHFRSGLPEKWKYSGNIFPLLLPLQKCTSSMDAIITMPGKPFQSVLIPYELEIKILRRRRPPMSYARITDHLQQKYGLVIQPPAIYKFLKVRRRGRKVFSYEPNVRSQKPPVARQSSQSATHNPGSTPKPMFNFAYSTRYSLHRLPPEEAAARRKKLEEEGH